MKFTLCICVFCLHICLYVHPCLVHLKARRECQPSWNWSYTHCHEGAEAQTQILWTVADAFNCWAICLAPKDTSVRRQASPISTSHVWVRVGVPTEAWIIYQLPLRIIILTPWVAIHSQSFFSKRWGLISSSPSCRFSWLELVQRTTHPMRSWEE